MIPRPVYIEKVRNFIDQPEIIKIITGIRRCGKSVMMRLLQDELAARGISRDSMITLNFEGLSLHDLKDPIELHNWLKTRIAAISGRVYLFLDEIQEVENWETCINSLRVETNADIYLTGSNARMLTGEYATHIAGRYIEMQLYPFSFSEYLTALRQKTATSSAAAFRKYLAVGGMPFIAALDLDHDDALQYLRDIFASVTIKDIVRKNNFRDVALLERIITYALANIGKTFSANGIANFFKSEQRKVAPETVLNYLKACTEAYLLYRIDRMDVPSKRQLKVSEKYYLADHGLREAVYGNNERDIELVLENMVCLELLRRGYKVRVGRNGDREIDFIGEKADRRLYVQVAYLLAGDATIAREFGAFGGIADNFPKYVVTMDEINRGREGILHRHIRDFLLAEDY